MANTGEALGDLERQAEARRAELALTIDELTDRVSARAIRADARSYVRERVEAVQRRALENPLQAAALAVGVAYPLWRMIGRLPAPLLLIGAGIALSRQVGSGNFESSARNPEGKRKTIDGVSAKASETVGRMRSLASETVANAAETLSEHYEAVREAAAGTADELSKNYSRTRDGLIDLFERHPVLSGGIAFALGSLVASSLPVTRHEDHLMGEVSDDVKHRTQDLASEGMAKAKTAAQHIYKEASSQVRDEGLTPETARNTVEAAVSTAREAVQQAREEGQGVLPTGRTSRNS